jgi:hypothetical protein
LQKGVQRDTGITAIKDAITHIVKDNAESEFELYETPAIRAMTQLSNKYINSVVREKIQNIKSKEIILRKIESTIPKKSKNMSKQQLTMKKEDFKDHII